MKYLYFQVENPLKFLVLQHKKQEISISILYCNIHTPYSWLIIMAAFSSHSASHVNKIGDKCS